MAQSDYLILSFDGGGIRGLISALLVQQLDREFNFLERVDLFAGTSTGGLLALGLASGVPIDNLVEVYMTRGGVVFEPNKSFSYLPAQPFVDLQEEAVAMSTGIWKAKYTADGLKSVVQETFPDWDKTLGELQRLVLVTTFDLYQPERKAWAPICLTNLPGYEMSDISVLDAALSTCGAPVYFPPHVFMHKGKKRAFVDGGVYANNPSMLAAASVIASGTLAARGLVFENIKLLSLGTGFTRNGIPPERISDPEGFGVLAWLCPVTVAPTPQFPLISVFMDGVSDINDFQCRQILGNNVRRGNLQLIEPINLDDYQKVGELRRMTEAYMASAEWGEIKEWLASEFALVPA
ncbi:MAG: patatin-like phospholipase family protein [Acidobacteria bacterium]|nr:patatin-like phospholipase family protein [Acidobacteriota bacterium]